MQLQKAHNTSAERRFQRFSFFVSSYSFSSLIFARPIADRTNVAMSEETLLKKKK